METSNRTNKQFCIRLNKIPLGPVVRVPYFYLHNFVVSVVKLTDYKR